MLYLVATPIGNLKDMSFRAVEILNESDYILCEDTRHSKKLLNHYEIKTPLKSYHKFNESKMDDNVIQDLKNGKTIALISDAGTPGISDPGEQLVKRCYEEGLTVSAIPGPCAAIQAVVTSGLCTSRFQFQGFLPRKKGEIKDTLLEAISYPGTSIFYESPNRIVKSLEVLLELSPNILIAVARELTKKFEEIVRGSAKEVFEIYTKKDVKGEIILLIEGQQQKTDWESLSPEEHVKLVEEEYGLSKKEAIKVVAELRGVPKRSIYSLFHR